MDTFLLGTVVGILLASSPRQSGNGSRNGGDYVLTDVSDLRNRQNNPDRFEVRKDETHGSTPASNSMTDATPGFLPSFLETVLMGKLPRRGFLKGSVASGLFGYAGAGGYGPHGAGGTDGSPPQLEEVPTATVTTRRELEAAFRDLSPGETVLISPENAPYRTTEWLDVDVDGVTVVGPGIKRLIVPADGADVGGIRVGHNASCSDVRIRGVGYHGNPENQSPDALRLHGIIVREAENVTLANNYVTRTHPYHVHGRGGSGISVEPGAVGVRIQNNRIYDIGDRGIQLAGEGILVSRNVITHGLDRSVAMDLWPSGQRAYQARNVSVVGNYLGHNSEGSLTGVGGIPQREDRGYYTIANNVGFGPHKCFCHLGFRGHAENVVVAGNVSVRDEGTAQRESGINLNATDVRNVVVANNELYDYVLNGINVHRGVAEFTIADNFVSSAGESGIRIAGQHGTVTGNSVVRSAQQGISLEGATDVSVDGNRVREAFWAGIAVRRESGAGRNRIHGNYVFSWDREGSGLPAIVVEAARNTVTDNFVRSEGGNGGPAIADRTQGGTNVHADNYATGSGPWVILDPTAVTRDNTPALGAHRNRVDDDGDGAVSVEFDRAYARPPRLSYGRRGGGIQGVTYATDQEGNVTGVTVETAREGGTVDLFVGD